MKLPSSVFCALGTITSPFANILHRKNLYALLFVLSVGHFAVGTDLLQTDRHTAKLFKSSAAIIRTTNFKHKHSLHSAQRVYFRNPHLFSEQIAIKHLRNYKNWLTGIYFGECRCLLWSKQSLLINSSDKLHTFRVKDENVSHWSTMRRLEFDAGTVSIRHVVNEN